MTSPTGGNSFFSKLSSKPPPTDGEERKKKLDVVAATLRAAYDMGPKEQFAKHIANLSECNTPENCDAYFKRFMENDPETIAKLTAVLSLLYVEHMQYIAVLQDTINTLTHEDFEKMPRQARDNMRTMRRSLLPIFGERLRFTFDEISPHLMDAVFGKDNPKGEIDAPTADAIFRHLFWGGALERPGKGDTSPTQRSADQHPVPAADASGAAKPADAIRSADGSDPQQPDSNIPVAKPSRSGSPVRLSWSKRGK